MSGDYGVFLGLDVGKGAHHAVGLDPAGKRLHDVALPNSERKLRAVFDKLRSGSVDRATMTDDSNYYFNPTVLGDYRDSLGPLGDRAGAGV